MSNCKITGVFISLYRKPYRVAFRYKCDSKHDRYEVYKPWKKIDAVTRVIEILSKEIPDFTKEFCDIDDKYYKES